MVAFYVLLEGGLGRCPQTCHVSKIYFAKVTNPDIKRTKLLFKDPVYISAVFGGVREAACVVQPRCLLKRGYYRSRRWCGFGDCAVDLIPDLIVGLIGQNCI
jgi:hypothetical protein